MPTLRFTDGVSVRTSGPLRATKLQDGWYVVGEGYLIPVDSYKEAQEVISEFVS